MLKEIDKIIQIEFDQLGWSIIKISYEKAYVEYMSTHEDDFYCSNG